MQTMPHEEEIAQQLALLRAHRATLAHALRQQALLGAAYTPPGVSHSIVEARRAIRHCKAVLRSWGCAIDELPDDQDPLSAAPPPPSAAIAKFRLEQGTVIKSYTLQAKVAEGGFGTVYRAEQMLVGRDVAIKVVRGKYADLPEFIRRFEAEAQIVARLEHPHIVPLYDYWRDATGAYLVMRWMSGGSLLDTIKHGRLPIDSVARLFEQITAALTLAHRRGVIHRDLKPANILLDEERHAYLADFGIAKDLGADNPSLVTHQRAFSPGYAAPEQILTEPVTIQADLYSLGVMLYELLTGTRAFSGTTPAEVIRQQLYSQPPSLYEQRPDLPKALDAVIQRAMAADRADRYPDVPSFVDELRQALDRKASGGHFMAAVDAALPAPNPITILLDETPLDNPYKGLRAFQEADAQDFFGREVLVQRLLGRLIETHASARFLAVVGPSGSGKSSLVRAGLVPRLRAGALPGSERWFIVQFIPGAQPLEELEAVLLRIAVNPPASLQAQLKEDERGLLRVVNQILPPDEAVDLVLVIDQFEEVFTLVEDEAMRAHFLSSLLTAVQDPHARIRIIITLRADFFDRPLQYAGFGELIRLGTAIVLPLTPSELEQAIVAPLQRVGAELEPELVNLIVQEVASQPGALPLLQYALTELFEQRSGRMLTVSAFRLSGGVTGALARRADALYESLTESGKAAARQLCLRLVTLGEGTEDTRRRVRRTELVAASPMRPADGSLAAMVASDMDQTQRETDMIIEMYGRYRLLTFDHDPITREPTVEVAHEALIRAWGRLRDWLNTTRDDIRTHRRLAAAAADWSANLQDSSYLATGARLEQLAAWRQITSLSLNAEEQAYLDASLAQVQDQHRIEAARLDHERRLASEVQSLALTFGAQEALAAGKTDLAIALAVAANRVPYAVEQAQIVLSQVAYIPRVAEKREGEPHISALAYSANRELAIIGLADRSVIVRNLVLGTEFLRLQGHTLPVTCAVFSPDKRFILTGGGDCALCLWDATDGHQLRWFRGHRRAITCAAFGPNNAILSGSNDTTLRLWDATSAQELRRFAGHKKGIISLAWGANGSIAVSSSEDMTIRVWDIASGREIQQFGGHTDIVQHLAFGPNDRTFASVGKDNTVRIWHIARRLELFTFQYPNAQPIHLEFAADGRSISLHVRDGSIYTWDLYEGAELSRSMTQTGAIWGLAQFRDGRRVISGSGDATVRVYDTADDMELIHCAGHTTTVTCVALSPDERTALSGSNDATLRLWDISAGQEIRRFTGHTHSVLCAAFSPNGHTVISGSADKTIRLWDPLSGHELRCFTGHTVWVVGVAFSPDGQYLLSGSSDRTLRLWDLTSAKEIARFTGHTRGVTSIAFSPDGRMALSGSEDGTIRLWNIETSKELQRLGRHTKGINAVAFSPDGDRVVSGSIDGFVQIWDIHTGQEQYRFSGHSGEVLSVVWAAQGGSVVSSSQDQTIRRWRIDTREQLVAWALENRHVSVLTAEQRAFYRLG